MKMPEVQFELLGDSIYRMGLKFPYLWEAQYTKVYVSSRGEQSLIYFRHEARRLTLWLFKKKNASATGQKRQEAFEDLYERWAVNEK